MSVDRVGRFGLVGVLGSGGFGTVYDGIDTVSGERVAVKVLDRMGGSAVVVRSQLLAEVDALRSVVSVNTLRVVDVVDEGDVLALVTDFVVGTSLRTVLNSHGVLSGPDALTVLRGAGLGLAAVHGAGLVHGDVKPANILVGPDGVSKLIDFGLVSLPGWISEDSASPWGSPAYAPPEQVAHNFRDHRSDIYSLTVTLFEVLCGQRPFGGDTVDEVRSNHVHQVLPDPRVFVPDLGDGLTQLLLWGLAKDPDARPQDVGTWLQYLEAAAEERYGPGWATAASVGAIAGAAVAGGLLASGVLVGQGATIVGANVVAGAGAGNAAAGSAGAGSAAVGSAGAASGAGGGSVGAAAGAAKNGLLASLPGPAWLAPIAIAAVAVVTAAVVAVTAVGGGSEDQVASPKPSASVSNAIDSELDCLVIDADFLLPNGESRPTDFVQGRSLSADGEYGRRGCLWSPLPDSSLRLAVTPNAVYPASNGDEITGSAKEALAEFMQPSKVDYSYRSELLQARDDGPWTYSLKLAEAFPTRVLPDDQYGLYLPTAEGRISCETAGYTIEEATRHCTALLGQVYTAKVTTPTSSTVEKTTSSDVLDGLPRFDFNDLTECRGFLDDIDVSQVFAQTNEFDEAGDDGPAWLGDTCEWEYSSTTIGVLTGTLEKNGYLANDDLVDDIAAGERTSTTDGFSTGFVGGTGSLYEVEFVALSPDGKRGFICYLNQLPGDEVNGDIEVDPVAVTPAMHDACRSIFARLRR